MSSTSILSKPEQTLLDNHMTFTWATAKVGWDMHCIDKSDLQMFAVHYLEFNSNLVNRYISELIFGVPDYEIDPLFTKIFPSLNLELPQKNSPLWNIEWRKWRFYLLTELLKNVQDPEELLMKVEGVYADFGYPEDMVSFIYYMPPENGIVDNNPEKARLHLIDKLKKFLNEEQKRIINGCDTLPHKPD
jgi:hypothetical protein